MGFTRTIRPRAIIGGSVVSTRELKKKPENGGEVYAYEVVVAGLNNAQIVIKAFPGTGEGQMAQHELPALGSFVVYECELADSTPQYPASINYAGNAFSLLDAFTSALSAPAKS